jgi:hypothetical protein
VKGVRAVLTIDVLLPWVELPVGRVGRVDPDLAGRVLEAGSTRGHMRHKVTPTDDVAELLREDAVYCICKRRVSGTR